MAVILARQAKMSGALSRVTCLLHRTEHHLADQCLIWLALDLVKDFLQFLRMCLSLDALIKSPKLLMNAAKIRFSPHPDAHGHDIQTAVPARNSLLRLSHWQPA